MKTVTFNCEIFVLADFIAGVLVYKKKMDSQSIMCYVSPFSHGSCAPSLNAPYLPLRDLERNGERKD